MTAACGAASPLARGACAPVARPASRARLATRAAAAPPPETLRVRRATLADVPPVAALAAAVFSPAAAAAAAAWALPPPPLGRRRPRSVPEWAAQLAGALERRAAAEAEARAAARAAAAPAAALARARLTPYAYRRGAELAAAAAARRRLRRQFACLVAEDRSTGELLACAAVALARPEAQLPPPLPTTAAVRCYLSNVAVAPGARRRGAAAALVAAAERLAGRWGYGELFLHVDAGNDPARALYAKARYAEAPRSLLMLARGQLLLWKRTSARAPYAGCTAGAEGADVGGEVGADGIFRWRVEEPL
jgi:ribosomal protein S18 acetylase RimI-like enzyme